MGQDDNQKETYLSLLKASLIKKSNILDELIQLSREQEDLINGELIDEAQFYKIIDDKEFLIQEILHLDKGFEEVFLRVKEEISVNRSLYHDKITQLQEIIKEITDKGIIIQALEKRNKAKMDTYLQTKRKMIKESKVNSKSINNYYKNMANQNQQESYFFDKKK